MKASIKLIYALLVTMVLNQGCDISLDENVYSAVTEENLDYKSMDITEMSMAVYLPFRWRLICHPNSSYMMLQWSADDIAVPANLAGGWYDGGVFRRIDLHSWGTEQNQIIEVWSALYKGVILANDLIEKIEQDLFASSNTDEILAEMRVARAFYYWLLLDTYGDVPLLKTTGKELPEKTDRSEIYQFIVTEIIESLPFLNENNDSSTYGRFNKWAAKALLANVYLNAETYTGNAEWTKVIEQTNDIIASNMYSLDDNFKDIFNVNSDSPEIIFAVPFDETNATGFKWQQFYFSTINEVFKTSVGGWGTGGPRGIPQFVNTFDEKDKRLSDSFMWGPMYTPDGEPVMGAFDYAGKHLVIKKEMENGLYVSIAEGYRMYKFKIEESALADANNDFPFFRYAQVLMMKAEALLRTNNTDEAAELVTMVRQRSFDEPNDAVVTGNDLMQNSVYNYGYVENYEIVDPGNQDPVEYGRMFDELGWEFVWEGFRRRDMIRFGIFTEKSWLSHQPQGDYRTVFPIPKEAIDANPKLEQNPDYL
ncbi:RagB/SusD family nutrient uptake outer membrane protein [Maribellus comscasis]|uniref:RagB/SusD family nutrient uptake outer membrane protein n=1 Tax=Maribellus comscasis TaxID=2681766 RepID=A0A6I6JNE5_9BACT|nr:RagB/SusD family nutrient uptake outer membrane protein [Maribellus comscasis]QGY43961.1 RagB/SusD family nutrient uptake outer membrane protein [Maribellus comscasis]